MLTQEITMTYVIHDIGVAKQIGKYSDAIETSATGGSSSFLERLA
jgi:hypothetical protein